MTRLRALLAGFEAAVVAGPADPEVSGATLDSRQVRPGHLFFAVAGQHTDGRAHVADAVARGAAGVVATEPIELNGAATSVAVVRAPTPRRLLGLVASRLAGDPSAALTLVAVTGTNGKTTTAYLLDGIWRAAGHRTGLIGTVVYRVGETSRSAPFTTPEAPELQALLAEMRAAGVTHAVMEVSSHALAQDRVAGCRFDAAVFTNLTRDHLDFHGDLDAYYAAKARLFLEHLPASGKADPVAVVNVDDPTGMRLAAAVRTRCVPVGRSPQAAVTVRDVRSTLDGTRGTLVFGSEAVPFTSPLVGAPHTENIMGAAATAWALGMAPETIAAGIGTAEPPPGRVERIAGPGFTVVVDYAHSPDALQRLLEAMRPLTPGALITVFGCGGDRDRGKRPIMGEAAARLSDVVVLTSDNPRTEEPLAILRDIELGVRAGGMEPLPSAKPGLCGYVVEPDRRAAVAFAIRLARPGDLVVVAGKGHEDYQIVGREKRHLDDREQVRQALEGLA
ncbi:MAG: UDP-N-acetylmuramoyl-L-alanyl-D-glutamate--2,6-diaminopimelate ligase [Candidatus Binatia bacterium]